MTRYFLSPRVLSFSPEITEDATPLITVVLTDDLGGIRANTLGLKLNDQSVPFVWTSSGTQVTLSYQVQSPLLRGFQRLEVLAQDYSGNVLDEILQFAVR